MSLTVGGGFDLGPTINAEGSPTLFTGLDPGGASSFVRFENADGTFSNTFHVFQNLLGQAVMTGVILDPPDTNTLTVDIFQLTSENGNGFVTPPAVPEPGTGLLAAAALIAGLALSCARERRTRALRRAECLPRPPS